MSEIQTTTSPTDAFLLVGVDAFLLVVAGAFLLTTAIRLLLRLRSRDDSVRQLVLGEPTAQETASSKRRLKSS